MSYSFTVQAKTKDDVGVKAEAALAEVVGAQPVHAADRQAAQDAIERFVDVLKEPSDGECISVSVSGSLGWSGDGVFTSASINISASVRQA